MTAPPPGAPAPGPVPGAEAAARLLADLRAEIARADSKAAVVVAALGIGAGVACGALAGAQWPSRRLSGFGAAVWWTGIAILAVALLCLLMAVVPRYRTGVRGPGTPLTHFGDIQRAVKLNRLPEALADTERLPMTALLTALTDTSRIALRKHQWIRAGLVAFCLGALALPLSVVIG